MRIYILSFILCLSLPIFGQTRNAYLDAADQASNSGNAFEALTFYNKAIEFGNPEAKLLYKAANAAGNINAYSTAVELYETLLEKNVGDRFPDLNYKLGLALQQMGKYAEAREKFVMYLSEHQGEDAYMSARASKESEACDWAVNQMSDGSDHILLERLGDGINSPNTQFGPFWFNEAFYYSSMDFENDSDPHIPPRPISKILIGDSDAAAGTVNEEINDKSLHTGHTSIDPAGQEIYYTVCNYEADNSIRCDIFKRKIMADGFGDAIKLPEAINMTEFSNTQPNISVHPETGNPRLYFSSDRTGGKGQYDLWYVDILGNDQYGSVMNVSAVNTAGNEYSPFYHIPTSTLYLSSDGYQGFGGLDIFSSKYIANNFEAPRVLEAPINSSYNDVYYSLSDDSRKAYFSSNRLGSNFLDPTVEACCYDIYRADITPIVIDLLANTFLFGTDVGLNGVTLDIYDMLYRGPIESLTNLDGNNFNYVMDRDKDYMIISRMENFVPDTMWISTKGIKASETIKRNIYLKSKEVELDLYAFDAETKFPLNGALVKITKLDDNSVVYDNLHMRDNYFNILLPGYGKYEITVSKFGYATEKIYLNPGDFSSTKIKREAFLQPLGYLAFLPLDVYFDNDEPDGNTWRETSRRAYSHSYYNYYAKKNEFMNEYSADRKPGNEVIAKENMETFFDVEIRGAFNNLQAFMRALRIHLEKGKTASIVLSGFASPRYTSEYNMALSKRRVTSVLKELKGFQEGSLVQYIENGQLSIEFEYNGENKAPSGISDSLLDRGSIYGIEASRERRTRIDSN